MWLTLSRLFGRGQPGAGAAQSPSEETSPQPHWIRDSDFIDSRDELQEVRCFLVKQGVVTPPPSSLGDLNGLIFKRRGRPPYPAERSALDDCAASIYSMLVGDLRVKFLATQAPWTIIWVAIGAVLCLVASTVIAFAFKGTNAPAACFAVWCASLGVIGAIAFVSMNVLSVQNDITFDFSNRRLTYLRIVMGALFALVISWAIGLKYYNTFIQEFDPKLIIPPPAKDAVANATANSTSNAPLNLTQAAFLLMPFILGFSTTVAIGVMSRLVQAVQALFGTLDVPKPAPTVPPNVAPESQQRRTGNGVADAKPLKQNP